MTTLTTELKPRCARKVHIIDRKEISFDDASIFQEMKYNIENHFDVYVIKNVADKGFLKQVKHYLHQLGTHSLPSYHQLQEGSPDFHRVCINDPRSPIKSTMHQYLFHPWNQNVLDLFNRLPDCFYIKNLMAGFKKDLFLNNTPKDDFIAKLVFQHYPTGGGYMMRHSDPIGEHQLVVSVLQVTTKGEDFKEGGFYVIDQDGQKLFIDDIAHAGDLLLSNGLVQHGIDPVDPGKPLDMFNEAGRWSLLAAVTKTPHNTRTPDALPIGKAIY